MKNIAYWKYSKTALKKPESPKSTIYPGYGRPADFYLFYEVKKYIEDFEETIARSKTSAEAMQTMRSLYPDHGQAGFLLYIL